jgi:hypothetical protein
MAGVVDAASRARIVQGESALHCKNSRRNKIVMEVMVPDERPCRV